MALPCAVGFAGALLDSGPERSRTGIIPRRYHSPRPLSDDDQKLARTVTPTVRGSPGLPTTRPEFPDCRLTNWR